MPVWDSSGESRLKHVLDAVDGDADFFAHDPGFRNPLDQPTERLFVRHQGRKFTHPSRLGPPLAAICLVMISRSTALVTGTSLSNAPIFAKTRELGSATMVLVLLIQYPTIVLVLLERSQQWLQSKGN
jgi:hypothetical protein